MWLSSSQWDGTGRWCTASNPGPSKLSKHALPSSFPLPAGWNGKDPQGNWVSGAKHTKGSRLKETEFLNHCMEESQQPSRTIVILWFELQASDIGGISTIPVSVTLTNVRKRSSLQCWKIFAHIAWLHGAQALQKSVWKKGTRSKWN